MKLDEDTIAAIATPVGKAGIGIIRISGSQALAIAQKLFKPKRPLREFETHRLYLGYIHDPTTDQEVDEVLLTYMKAPWTYTREDIVEINCHSGFVLLSRILQLVLDAGARLANPGEFTFRAFMNGRIDLTQAEAVADLINSSSEKGLYLTSQLLKGALGERIRDLRDKTVEILTLLESVIDFPEEETSVLDRERVSSRLTQEIIGPISSLIEAHEERKIWVDGLKTVIVGRVNAGKSSLLNRLLDEPRAIVTPIPGTTRDVVESTITINGIPLRLMDTAGIRKVTDEVEAIGITLAEQKAREADLVLVVVDQSRDLNPDDFQVIKWAKAKKAILVLNKIDLPPIVDPQKHTELFGDLPIVKISALTGEGIERLKGAIEEVVVKGGRDFSVSSIAPNLRQTQVLKDAMENFKAARDALSQGAPFEIVAFELKTGLDALGHIVGETTPDEVLNRIFEQFCIGK